MVDGQAADAPRVLGSPGHERGGAPPMKSDDQIISGPSGCGGQVEISITAEAIEHIRRKGGVAAIDFIPPLG